MSAPGGTPAPPLDGLAGLLAGADRKADCAALYSHPAVRWLVGDELHPGGAATTRRALELIGLGPGERLLDVASGSGASALLAARELGCVVAGLDYSADAVVGAQRAAEAAGLCNLAGFVVGDAEALPFGDGEFDAVLCECSLCTFPDKPRALAEIHRVLRPGGRLALADVVVEPERLPAALSGTMAALACIGEALPLRGYEELLASAGFRVRAREPLSTEAAALAERVHDRLRGARLLGLGHDGEAPLAIEPAIELAAAAREAIAAGALGYAIVAAAR